MTGLDGSAGGGWRLRPPWPWLAAVAVPLTVYLAVVAAGYDGGPYLRGDCPYYYLTAVSLLADGDVDLGNQLPGEPSRFSEEVALDRRGRLVPKHPIALPLASLPLVGLLGPPGALLFNLLQLTLLVALLYRLTRRIAAPWAAAAATAATGAATLLPHYAWNYSPDVFSTLLLVGALAALPAPVAPASRYRLLTSGALLGLAVASKFPLGAMAPLFFFVLPRPRLRAALPFGLGAALPLLALAAYDTYLFGAPWMTSYDRIAQWTDGAWGAVSQRRDFGDPLGAGLVRQLMDRRHGLIPTTPLTVLSLAALPWLRRRWRGGAVLVGGGAAALLVFFAGYRLWDHSHHGNRFLLPLVALAALPLAPALEAAGRRIARLRSRRPSRTDLVFTLVVVLQLVPLWSVDYLPTQDGPAHLGGASLLLDLHRRDRPWLREVYELSPRPDPTWASHLALASLLGTFPPGAAEKLFLSAYLVVFPLTVRRALRALRPGAEELAFLALPLSASYLYHLGFYSFCWSLAVLAAALAYWLRRSGALDTGRERLAFAGFGLLLWLGHPVTLVAAAVAVAAAGSWLATTTSKAATPGDGEPFSGRLLRRCGVPLAALSPALALVAAFAAGGRGEPMRWMPLRDRLRLLVTLDPLTSFERREIWLAAAMGLLLAITAAVVLRRRARLREWARADAMLVAAGGCLVLFLAAPDSAAGGGWISHRLLVISLLLFVLWLGAQPLTGGLKRACQVGSALVALGLAALHGAEYAQISPYLAEHTALARRTPPGATLLPMTASPWGTTPSGRPLSAKVRPFVNAAGYAAAESENAFVLLDSYQAALPYFPVRYRPGRRPPPPPGPAAEIPLADRSPTGAPDLVLLWGAAADPPLAGYRRVAVSAPTSLGRLYAATRPPDRLAPPGRRQQ